MHMESSSKHLSGAPQKKKAKKSPQYGFIPPDEGEDDVSYERHVRCMKAEFSKRRANGAFVAQLMKLSYGHRRSWILAEARDAQAILEQCPFLTAKEHVSLCVSAFSQSVNWLVGWSVGQPVSDHERDIQTFLRHLSCQRVLLET